MNNDLIINLLEEFTPDHLTRDSVLSKSINLFSSLVRIRIIAKLEEKYTDLDFDWINDTTNVKEIENFVKNYTLKEKNNQINSYKYSSDKEYNFKSESFRNISIGVDVEHIDNLPKNILEISSLKLREKLFTEKEIIYALQKNNTNQTLLGLFTAKESIIKAYSRFGELGIKDIEIYHLNNGRPKAKVKHLEGKYSIDISISHSIDYAISGCIILKL